MYNYTSNTFHITLSVPRLQVIGWKQGEWHSAVAYAGPCYLIQVIVLGHVTYWSYLAMTIKIFLVDLIMVLLSPFILLICLLNVFTFTLFMHIASQ